MTSKTASPNLDQHTAFNLCGTVERHHLMTKRLSSTLTEFKQKPVTFREECIGAYSGQTNIAIYANIGSVWLATMQYTLFEGKVSVNYFEWLDVTKDLNLDIVLARMVQAKFPGMDIGARGISDNIPLEEVVVQGVVDKQNELARIKNRLDVLQRAMETMPGAGYRTPEQEDMLQAAGDEFNEINDREWELENELNGEPATISLVKMAAVDSGGIIRREVGHDHQEASRKRPDPEAGIGDDDSRVPGPCQGVREPDAHHPRRGRTVAGTPQLLISIPGDKAMPWVTKTASPRFACPVTADVIETLSRNGMASKIIVTTIASNPSRPYLAYRYALNCIQGPWPAAETVLLKDPATALFYATNVLKRPWPEAELVLAPYPLVSYEYALKVLHLIPTEARTWGVDYLKSHKTAASVPIPDDSSLTNSIWNGLLDIVNRIPADMLQQPIASFVKNPVEPNKPSTELHPILVESIQIPKGMISGWSGELPVYVVVTVADFRSVKLFDGAMLTKVDGDPECMILQLTGSRSAARVKQMLEGLETSTSSIEAKHELSSMIRHELTHATQFNDGTNGSPSEGMESYVNTPSEFEAFLQQILTEMAGCMQDEPKWIQEWYGPTPTKVVQGVLDSSATWRRYSKAFTLAHRQEVFREVSKKLHSLGVFSTQDVATPVAASKKMQARLKHSGARVASTRFQVVAAELQVVSRLRALA